MTSQDGFAGKWEVQTTTATITHNLTTTTEETLAPEETSTANSNMFRLFYLRSRGVKLLKVKILQAPKQLQSVTLNWQQQDTTPGPHPWSIRMNKQAKMTKKRRRRWISLDTKHSLDRSNVSNKGSRSYTTVRHLKMHKTRPMQEEQASIQVATQYPNPTWLQMFSMLTLTCKSLRFLCFHEWHFCLHMEAMY